MTQLSHNAKKVLIGFTARFLLDIPYRNNGRPSVMERLYRKLATKLPSEDRLEALDSALMSYKYSGRVFCHLWEQEIKMADPDMALKSIESGLVRIRTGFVQRLLLEQAPELAKFRGLETIALLKKAKYATPVRLEGTVQRLRMMEDRLKRPVQTQKLD